MAKKLKIEAVPPGTVRVCLTADNHLRDSHLGVFRRGPDFTEAVLRAIDVAKAQGCHAILQGGDFLNTSKPSSQNIRDLMRIHAYLEEVEMPMFLIDGNHDKSDPPWSSAVLPAAGEGRTSGIIPSNHRTVGISNGAGNKIQVANHIILFDTFFYRHL